MKKKIKNEKMTKKRMRRRTKKRQKKRNKMYSRRKTTKRKNWREEEEEETLWNKDIYIWKRRFLKCFLSDAVRSDPWSSCCDL